MKHFVSKRSCETYKMSDSLEAGHTHRKLLFLHHALNLTISSKLSKLDYSSSFRPRGGSMGDFGVARDKWVCPNDRELSLRA
ncbi:hypothetical protein TNCT_501871, partial [Trichonephila clavata]